MARRTLQAPWFTARLPAVVSALVTGGLVWMLLALAFPLGARLLSDLGSDAVLSVAANHGATPEPPAIPVAIIDIDAASLEAFGPWPWRRNMIGELVDIATRAGARVVAVDILFSDPEARSPEAQARRLAETLNRPELAAIADGPDDDARLAGAMAQVPTVLGFTLASEGGVPRSAPVVLRGNAAGFWTFPAAELPVPVLAGAAAGQGALAIPVDRDGVVRSLPLYVVVGQDIRPSLATEAVRLANGAPFHVLDTDAGKFALGEMHGALDDTGLLRLLPNAPAIARYSAGAPLSGRGAADALQGAVVFIGGSAPQMGGLRSLPGGVLSSSLELQARAAAQILSGQTPVRPDISRAAVPLALVLAALAALLSPLRAVAVSALVVAAAALGALRAAELGLLIDPLLPLAVYIAAFVAGILQAFALDRRRAAGLRRRFEQHLAPQVVAMIARDPSVLRLAGQRRVITALFTDVESFTAMVGRIGPDDLIALLDGYFDGLTRIVHRHGGMVDKFVGDAVHAYFNAPLDLPDHALAALECAQEIADWSETFRTTEPALGCGFGRTRIGLESGPAVLGDVGQGAKLDYTAHGAVVNTAARLEAANKELGTTICIGPVAAGMLPPARIRPVGSIELRGIGTGVSVFTVAAPVT